MTTPPRQVLPDQDVFITWRAVNRSFRFVPTKKVTETLWYILAYVASELGVSIFEATLLSNHGHMMARFPGRTMPSFMRRFNSLAARALNAMYGINGTVIERHYSVVRPEDRERLLEHCAYTLANPCSANLVTRAVDWKGLTTARMNYGDNITLEKPRYGLWAPSKPVEQQRRKKDARPSHLHLRGRSRLPDAVEFRLARPDGFDGMSDEELRGEVRRRVEVLEDEAEVERVEAGTKVLGMRRVRVQHFRSIPGPEDMFGRRPNVSASDRWGRIEAIQRRQGFLSEYREARDRWREGEREVVFPFGTWQMLERHRVQCRGPDGSVTKNS